MGPLIILDKSALQALSQSEIHFLFKHYYVVIPPVLVIEIVADLKKQSSDKDSLLKQQVSILANKLGPLDSCISVSYQNACLASLFGQPVPMNGRVPVAGGETLHTKGGQKFDFFDESPVMKTIQRWQAGIFSELDESLAEKWRRLSREVDLEACKKTVRELLPGKPTVKSIQELTSTIDHLLHSSDAHQTDQMALLSIIMDLINAPQLLRNAIFQRWLNQSLPLLGDFAPYAYFCLRTYLLFHLALICGLVGTKRTNIIDLEYLFYAPFCMAFCSGDKFHAALTPAVLRNDQTFVPRDDLKKDLNRLVTEWDSLSEEQRTKRACDYGSYPPPNPDSVTHQLWVKHGGPWQPGSGNRALNMTEEESKKLMEQLRPFMEAIDQRDK